MAIEFSPVISSQSRATGGTFFVKSLELAKLGQRASPIVALDQFRVRGRPFGPHPHAGFSAITYVLEDSAGACRSRDSLGNDIITGPGGIVWAQSGNGIIHDETPADPAQELHGIQLFVNLSARYKSLPPQVFALANAEVPEWRSSHGDRVRAVVGSYAGFSSPLTPAERFTLLDAEIKQTISIDVEASHNLLVYVLSGEMLARAGRDERKLASDQAVAISGIEEGGRVSCEALRRAHVLLLYAQEIREPVVIQGSFIMNDAAGVEAALRRFRTGGMGRLAPL